MGVEYEHWLLPTSRDLRPSTDAVARLVGALRRDRWVLSPEMPRFQELRGGFGTPRDVRDEDDTGGHASLFGKNTHQPRRALPIHEVIPPALASKWIDARLDASHPSPLAREIALAFPLFIPDDVFSDWSDAGLQYPFTFGEDDASNYHKIEIFLADDFVAHDWTNAFSIGIDTRCECGTTLRYLPDQDHIEWVPAIGNQARIHRVCPRCGARFDPSTRATTFKPGWDATSEPLRGGVTFRFAVHIDCHKGWPRDHGRLRVKPAFRELVEASIGEAFEDFGGLD
jgi:hypothetical protein